MAKIKIELDLAEDLERFLLQAPWSEEKDRLKKALSRVLEKNPRSEHRIEITQLPGFS